MASIAAGSSPALTGRPSPLRMLWITAALGVCFLGIQWGLRDAPLLWFAALRALLGGAALAIVALWQRRPLPPSLHAWGRIATLGLVNVSPVSYTHLRAHETVLDLVCRLLLEKK